MRARSLRARKACRSAQRVLPRTGVESQLPRQHRFLVCFLPRERIRTAYTEPQRVMEIDIKLVFDILAFTSVMVLIVLGLGVIASMMGIFNFAHGEFVLLGAYTVYLSASAGLGLWFGIFAAPIVVGLVGLVMERIIIRRFYASPII